jgi:adenylate cyclase
MTGEEKIELELAWLVRNLPSDLDNCKSTEIKQAYLSASDPKIKDIRIREKEGKYTHTVKSFIRNSQETGYNSEETKKLSRKEFMRLWTQAEKKVRKTRYFYPLSSGYTAEIDIYKDNLEGLRVVEVEFASIDYYKNFKAPKWFGKEVTDSKGIYPPVIADMRIEQVNRINSIYQQKPHDFE